MQRIKSLLIILVATAFFATQLLAVDSGTPAPLKQTKQTAKIAKAKNPSADKPKPDFADLPYGPDPQNKLDVWLAKSDKPTPWVVNIHGGGFMYGDKNILAAIILKELLKAGISVVSINYRLTTTPAPLPIPHHDAARALQFLRYKAKDFNLDPTRVGVYGGSAGAGICLWLAFHKDMAQPGDADPIARQSTRVNCAATSGAQSSYDPHVLQAWCGPTIIESQWLLPAYGVKTRAELNDPKLQPIYDEVSAIKHLTKDAPPTFLIYHQPNIKPEPTDASGKNVHHPIFGFKVKEIMDQLGCECTCLNTKEGDYAKLKPVEQVQHYQMALVDFLKKHLIGK